MYQPIYQRISSAPLQSLLGPGPNVLRNLSTRPDPVDRLNRTAVVAPNERHLGSIMPLEELANERFRRRRELKPEALAVLVCYRPPAEIRYRTIS